MSLPVLHTAADTRSITERVNVLIRDYNTLLRVPAGCILAYAGTTAPDGFLLCAGQAVSRAAYGDLFAAIGTAYGAGDGSATFNVPDLRGRVVAGKDDMGGTDAGRLGGGVANRMTLGGTGGAATHTLSIDEMPAHGHGVNDPLHFHYYGMGGVAANGVNVRGTSGDGTNFGYAATNVSATGISIRTAGSGGAHNNTQPTLVLNYVIAT